MLGYFLYMVSQECLMPSTYTLFKKQKLGEKYYLNRIRNILGQMWEEALIRKFLTTNFSTSKPNSTKLFSEVQKVQTFLLPLIWCTGSFYY